MVTADNSNGGVGWAQIGYGKFSPNYFSQHAGFYEYAQWVKQCTATTCDYHDKFGSHPSYGSATFNSSYKSGDGHIHMFIDGAELAESAWSPTPAWQPAWQAQFFAETKFNESDVPGTDNNRVRFLNNEKETDGIGNWQEFNSLSGLAGPARYHFETTGTHSDFKIWTKPLNTL